MRRGLALGCACLLLAGCGATTTVGPSKAAIPASLLAGLRPIGRGARFEPPDTGPIPGPCEPTLGRREAAHVEVFGANQVVLLAKGIGTGPPRAFTEGRLTRAGCFGTLVTLDPTGTVYFRAGKGLTLADVFRAWGQPLTPARVASFTGGRTTVFVGGARWRGAPGSVPLTSGAEIVVEIGPRVPPHIRFTFPKSPPASLR